MLKNCSLCTLLTATDRKPQNHKKGSVNHTNIDIQTMLVCVTLPFYDVCSFRSVAVNSVYKLQFFTFIHRLRGSASPVLTATGLVNGKWQFSTPHRIDTPQPITKKFVTCD